jgi:hypothetical protein
MTRYAITLVTLTLALTGFGKDCVAATCAAESADHRVALLELYTSEGCNSCPPADRWLSSLQDRGFDTRRVIPLAFHVDYWDYIGWHDRFAQPEFSQRQRAAAQRNNTSFIYTPQFIYDGQDFRSPWVAGRMSDKLQPINSQSAALKMQLQHSTGTNSVHALLKISNSAAQSARVYLVLFENGLHSAVSGGENAGKKLYHDYVVRKLSSAVTVAAGQSLAREFDIDIPPDSDPHHLGLAAFAENTVSGATMQAMAVALCDG